MFKKNKSNIKINNNKMINKNHIENIWIRSDDESDAM